MSLELYAKNTVYTERNTVLNIPKVRFQDTIQISFPSIKTSMEFQQYELICIITIQSDRDRDTGRYTIRLTCEAGTFEASGNVNVLDVPLKPRALVPDEVRAEHVKLSWQPPADDGGTPITSYLVRYMDIDTGEWVTSCTVSIEFWCYASRLRY